MARQHNFSESLRSVAGGALIGLGLRILVGNLDRVAAQLRHLGANAAEGLPSVALATSQAVQVYGLEHQGFWLGLLRVLVLFWPLLLVIAGTTLLQDALTDKVKASPTPVKYFRTNKDPECRFCCPSFDV